MSLSVSPHEIVALMGPNGCGKTTLLNIVAGDLAPDSGRIELNGMDLLRLPTYRRCWKIGRVHQESYKALAAELTVGEVLTISSKRGVHLSLGFPNGNDAIALLRHLSVTLAEFLAERSRLMAETLSGGQRQLLALAVAVLGTPQVLLLDEHRASLDEEYTVVADELLRKYILAYPSAAVVATHDHEWTRAQNARIAAFVDGRIDTTRESAVAGGCDVHL